jgi:hypothetical protein
MTIGIVFVACLAARIAGKTSEHEDINVELHEFGHETWNAVRLSFRVALLDQNGFAVDMPSSRSPSERHRPTDRDW